MQALPSPSWTHEATAGCSPSSPTRGLVACPWDAVLGGPCVWAGVRQHALEGLKSYKVSSLMILGQN